MKGYMVADGAHRAGAQPVDADLWDRLAGLECVGAKPEVVGGIAKDFSARSSLYGYFAVAVAPVVAQQFRDMFEEISRSQPPGQKALG